MSMRYLFMMIPGSGNQFPMVGLAQRLAQKGHQVTFAGFEPSRALCEAHGLEFVYFPKAHADWAAAGYNLADWGRYGIANPSLIQDVPELIQAHKPDRIIVDFLMGGVLAALEKNPPPPSIPVYVLSHTTPSGGKSAAPMLIPAFNMIRTAIGLAPVEDLWDAFRGAAPQAIVTSIPELDINAAAVGPSWNPYFKWVGPQFMISKKSNYILPWPASDARPLILVSFSSSDVIVSQKSRIVRTLTALGDSKKYRIICTYKEVSVDGIEAAENIVLVKEVPHSEILPYASATVTHAGLGTVSISLAYGVPLVCLPAFADQTVNANQIAALGAGVALDGENASVEEIRSAVDSVLTTPSYKNSAQSLQKKIQEYDTLLLDL